MQDVGRKVSGVRCKGPGVKRTGYGLRGEGCRL